MILVKCKRCKLLKPRNEVSVWKQECWTLENNCVLSLCRKCMREQKSKYSKTEKGKRAILEASKRAYIRHKEKWVARAKLRYAVKMGRLNKPLICEVCNLKKILQGHHEDYSKPLEVIWLCHGCHADADRTLENNK